MTTVLGTPPGRYSAITETGGASTRRCYVCKHTQHGIKKILKISV